MPNKLYTQRDWDRTVGMGKVPYKYSLEAKIREDMRAERIRENVYADMGESPQIDSGRTETRQSDSEGVSKTTD